ncbi:MAG: LytR C-terminal domain-containing protein [Acidimicrobiales bacterium]|nr:LytR C-terminal domain-containing protein [Acidimicrobiales bacterium]
MAARRSSGGRPPANAALRGGGLIVVSVLIGVALLAWGFSEEGGLVETDPTATTAPSGDGDPDTGDETGDENGDGDADPGITTDDGTETTEPGEALPQARPPEDTGIYVRNGSGVNGAAGRVRDHLLALNYILRSPDNAPDRVAETAIYYEEGWRAEALEVAGELGVTDEIVAPLPIPAPAATEMGDTQILILLGEDERIGIAQGEG